MTAKVEFLASFPPIQSAIKRGNDGMRITLDIPESEVPKAVLLMSLMETVLKVTIESEKQVVVPVRASVDGVQKRREIG